MGLSALLALRVGDDRRHARGLRDEQNRMWVEGDGVVPIGWEDCAWDYEQAKGYSRFHYGATERAWSAFFERDHDWTFDEVGVWEDDFSDELEDELTGTAPMRRTRRGIAVDLQPPPPPFPFYKETDLDEYAREWDRAEQRAISDKTLDDIRVERLVEVRRLTAEQIEAEKQRMEKRRAREKRQREQAKERKRLERERLAAEQRELIRRQRDEMLRKAEAEMTREELNERIRADWARLKEMDRA